MLALSVSATAGISSLAALDQIGDAQGPIEHRELGVNVEVDELGGGHAGGPW